MVSLQRLPDRIAHLNGDAGGHTETLWLDQARGKPQGHRGAPLQPHIHEPDLVSADHVAQHQSGLRVPADDLKDGEPGLPHGGEERALVIGSTGEPLLGVAGYPRNSVFCRAVQSQVNGWGHVVEVDGSKLGPLLDEPELQGDVGDWAAQKFFGHRGLVAHRQLPEPSVSLNDVLSVRLAGRGWVSVGRDEGDYASLGRVLLEVEGELTSVNHQPFPLHHPDH